MTSEDTSVERVAQSRQAHRERLWTNPALSLEDRIESLISIMTLEEKLAQLGGAWYGTEDTGENVAPMQDVFNARKSYEELTEHGIGHLTRVFGTKPVEPVEGARQLARMQQELIEQTRLGIPAIAHEECLTGFTTFHASQFPTPLAWAASFDLAAVEQIGNAIGESMRDVGVHQGLAPVMDVVRDYRWGRVEETLGEDPYLVGMMGSAYVRGLEAAGIVATPKHFAGYSASRGGRNHAPVSMGQRELFETILPPFEMALREGGARSLMNSYADIDGVPPAANATLLTEVLRERWGFTGVVVSDYWSLAFLCTMHGVAGTLGTAGALALHAGIDIELPDLLCYGEPLAQLVRSGEVPEEIVDRALRRVLRQKGELGLLDADWSPQPRCGTDSGIDLDPPRNRELARELAERSVVLLENREGMLPLSDSVRSIAVVGPCADQPLVFLGCYSFSNHILPRYPDLGSGLEIPSLLTSLRAELPGATISYVPGCSVQERDRTGFDDALAAARSADLCVVAVGDRAGLFGRGTSGEGCDVQDLSLPGVQGDLVEALLASGTPVVLVVVSGRPYALGAYSERVAAAVQAFFPGEEGGSALAGVLSGRVVPSGKLPVQIPRWPGGQPGTYLQPRLGRDHEGISNVDPSPLFAFGHGLSYTEFEYSNIQLSAVNVPTDGEIEISCLVRNVGAREGTEVVQLYLADPVAEVTRPMLQLAGFARVPLEPGQQASIRFRLDADRTSFVGLDLERIVQPGEIRVMIGSSSSDLRLEGAFQLTGTRRSVGFDRVLTTPVEVAFPESRDGSV